MALVVAKRQPYSKWWGISFVTVIGLANLYSQDQHRKWYVERDIKSLNMCSHLLDDLTEAMEAHRQLREVVGRRGTRGEVAEADDAMATLRDSIRMRHAADSNFPSEYIKDRVKELSWARPWEQGDAIDRES